MGGLFESPKAEAQPVWERIPPEAKNIYMNFLRQYSQFLGQTGGVAPPSPLPVPQINIGGGTVQVPPELRQRYVEVLSGRYDPTTSPGMQAIISRMEEGGRRATEQALQRLAMAGQGAGTPMAQATAELAGVTQARIGEALQEALNREYQAALGMMRETLGTDIANLQAQLQRDAAQAQLELQRYGMVTQETMNRYLTTLQALQSAATMTTNLMGAFLPPPQYGPPPIMGLLGPLSLFFK